MKLKKIIAGMAASVLAVSLMSGVSVSADSVSGNAGIMFQMENWTARYEFGNRSDFGPEGGPKAEFPNKCIGVNGGNWGFQTDANIHDTAITGDGTYTVSIPCSGTVNAGLWVYDDGTDPTGKQLEWSLRNSWGKDEYTGEIDVATRFNMIQIATDIEWDYWDDEAQKPVVGYVVGERRITCKDITVEFTESGKTYTLDEAPCNSEYDYLTFQVINVYNTDFEGINIPAEDIPTSGDMVITFTIDGFDLSSADSSTVDSSTEDFSTADSSTEDSSTVDSSTEDSSTADSSTADSSTTDSTPDLTENHSNDINGDNAVDIKDVIRLQKYINDNLTEVNAAAVDINSDGEVNIKDVIRLQKTLNA